MLQIEKNDISLLQYESLTMKHLKKTRNEGLKKNIQALMELLNEKEDQFLRVYGETSNFSPVCINIISTLKSKIENLELILQVSNIDIYLKTLDPSKYLTKFCLLNEKSCLYAFLASKMFSNRKEQEKYEFELEKVLGEVKVIREEIDIESQKDQIEEIPEQKYREKYKNYFFI